MDKPIAQRSYLRVIRFFISESPDVRPYYFLWHEGIRDYPINIDGSPILFESIEDASRIAEKYVSKTEVDEYDLCDVFMECDVPSTLSYIADGGVDIDCCVLDTINLLLDFIDVLRLPLLAGLRPELNRIADYATLNTDMNALLDVGGLAGRDARIKAILTLFGAIIVRSRIEVP